MLVFPYLPIFVTLSCRQEAIDFEIVLKESYLCDT